MNEYEQFLQLQQQGQQGQQPQAQPQAQGLMEYIKALMMEQQQTQAPKVDSYGVELPNQPQPSGAQQHAGGMMGGKPMDLTQMQMIMRMFGGGQ